MYKSTDDIHRHNENVTQQLDDSVIQEKGFSTNNGQFQTDRDLFDPILFG